MDVGSHAVSEIDVNGHVWLVVLREKTLVSATDLGSNLFLGNNSKRDKGIRVRLDI